MSSTFLCLLSEPDKVHIVSGSYFANRHTCSRSTDGVYLLFFTLIKKNTNAVAAESFCQITDLKKSLKKNLYILAFAINESVIASTAEFIWLQGVIYRTQITPVLFMQLTPRYF